MQQHVGVHAGLVRRARSGLALGSVVVLAAVVLAACGSSDSGSDPTTTKGSGGEETTTTVAGKTTTTAASAAGELDGQSFIGTGIEGYEPVPDSELVISFEDGQMSVNAGCNTLGSGYVFNDGFLKFMGAPRSTMMSCSAELEAQDEWLNNLFSRGVEAVLDDDTLTLTSGEIVITMTGVAESPLTGTTWSLDSTVSDQAVSSLPAGVDPATLTIDEDGTAGVFTGCNSGSTTVEVTDTTLTFGPIALTRMACVGGGSELEAQVTAVLDGTVSYTVEGDTLTLMNGTSGLVFKAS